MREQGGQLRWVGHAVLLRREAPRLHDRLDGAVENAASRGRDLERTGKQRAGVLVQRDGVVVVERVNVAALTADREQRVQTFDLALRRLQRLSSMVSVGGQRHGRVHREQVDRLGVCASGRDRGGGSLSAAAQKNKPEQQQRLDFFLHKQISSES